MDIENYNAMFIYLFTFALEILIKPHSLKNIEYENKTTLKIK